MAGEKFGKMLIDLWSPLTGTSSKDIDREVEDIVSGLEQSRNIGSWNDPGSVMPTMKMASKPVVSSAEAPPVPSGSGGNAVDRIFDALAGIGQADRARRRMTGLRTTENRGK